MESLAIAPSSFFRRIAISDLPRRCAVLALTAALGFASPSAAADDPSCQGTFVVSFYSTGPCANPPGSVARSSTYEWFDCHGARNATIYTSLAQTCNTVLDSEWAAYAGQSLSAINSTPQCTTALPGPLVARTCSGKDRPKPECPRGEQAAKDPGNLVGDPVDLTTGQLLWSATDLDLGGGLSFRRHYASDSQELTEMGRRWNHALDWRAARYVKAAGLVTVMIRPPFADAAVFAQSGADPSQFVGGRQDVGQLEVEAGGRLLYTAADGTIVTFRPDDSLEEIRLPGEAPIAVSVSGAVTTYSDGARTLVVESYASGANAGRVKEVRGHGDTWS